MPTPGYRPCRFLNTAHKKYTMTLREWQRKIKNPDTFIVQASVIDGSDSWQEFPIGMCFNYGAESDLISIQQGSHSQTVLCALNDGTDGRRRPVGLNRRVILDNLKKNGIQNGIIIDYFQKLPEYKFVISPEGNGVDCHRHYEALMAGSIPVIERNPLIKQKYKGCPILFTSDYSEITKEYLEARYAEMIDTEYDFSRLFMDYYTPDQNKTIRECGNVWMVRHTGKKWYSDCAFQF